MKLIIGLGNPEEQYKNTRHNVGFLALDEFAKLKGLTFEFDKYSNSEISKEADLILAKPQTFMNNSGSAVQALTTTYKLQPTSLLIVHDDIDLPFGKMRLQKNRSSAGHKGVQSIIDALGTQDFARLRIGINNPETRHDYDTETYVLQKLSSEETKKLEEIFQETNKKIQTFLAT